MSRLFVISDIHGHVEGARRLLDKAAYVPGQDRLVLLGDYIDKDPATYSALGYVRSLVEQGALAIAGNMERNLLRQLMKGEVSEKAADRAFLASLPLYVKLGDYLFVHAGIRAGVPLAQQREEDLIGIRHEFWGTPAADKTYTIVFGHTPSDRIGAAPGEVWQQPYRLGIDTGAKHGMRLTLVELTQHKVYSYSTNAANLNDDYREASLPLL